MGFSGGGAIRRRKDSVKGTSSAASIWVTGAIGMAVGLGSLDVAVMLSVATVETLWIMSPLKRAGRVEPPESRESEDSGSRLLALAGGRREFGADPCGGLKRLSKKRANSMGVGRSVSAIPSSSFAA